MSKQWPPSPSRVYGIQLDDPREGYLWLQQNHFQKRQIVVLSRMSPVKLSRWINLEHIDFHWLTSKNDRYAIDPALERMNHFIDSLVCEGEGIIWLDAVEYLSDLHGFDSLIQFIQSISDALMMTKWTLVLPYSTLGFKATEVAKIRREAPNYDIIKTDPTTLVDDDIDKIDQDELNISSEEDTNQLEFEEEPEIEVEPGLVVLSRIPEKSLSRAILQRRLEQWKDMGFDISELSPLLLIDDRSERYSRYFQFEEKVRRATECERRIRELKELGFTKESTILHFRIMQLTGLDDVENIIQQLLAEAR